MDAIKVDLPDPSSHLIKTVLEFADQFQFDLDKKRWLDEFHRNKINSGLHHFDSPGWLGDLLQKEYQGFFPLHRISGMIGIVKNSQDSVACLPPHTDRSRAVGLNYFLELGGTNVETVFYDQVNPIVGMATNIPYDQLKEVGRLCVAEPGWYCYRVERAHSVENIESRRIFIAIRLVKKSINQEMDFEYNIDDFVCDYPHLLKPH